MKAYFDANIYVSYLLGQKNCEIIERIFREGAKCKFSIVLSQIALREIDIARKGSGSILFLAHSEKFSRLGKIRVITADEEECKYAAKLNDEMRRKLGSNDVLHSLLAKKHADVFITSDIALCEYASKTIPTFTPAQFLSRLQA